MSARQAADLIQEAIDADLLSARLVPLGKKTLAKNAGDIDVFWLGDERDPTPSEISEERTQAEVSIPSPSSQPDSASLINSQQNLARLRSLAAINDYVEKFHVFACRCDSATSIRGAFRKYLRAILSTLRWPAPFGNLQGKLEADVLELMPNGKLQIDSNATNRDHVNYTPKMVVVAGDAPPAERSGVAVYVVWANTSKVRRRGVAIAKDVHTSDDIEYHERTAHSAPEGGGPYSVSRVEHMYKPAPNVDQLGRPPYRSILSAPILKIVEASAAPLADAQFTCMGVLNVTCSIADAFFHQDCAWAETAASLVGSLYESRDEALARLQKKARRRATANSAATSKQGRAKKPSNTAKAGAAARAARRKSSSKNVKQSRSRSN